MWQLIPSVIDGISSFFKGKAKLNQAELEGQISIIKQASTNVAQWEQIHAKGSQTSWKDEFWTIIFAIPLVGGFLGFQEEVNRGFMALSNMPDWYQYTLVTMVLASFGIRMNNLIRGKM